MESQLVIATSFGLKIMREINGEWEITQSIQHNTHFTAVSSLEDKILAGSKSGIFRSYDRGKTWQESNRGLDVLHIRALKINPHNPDLILAGTEPAAIFTSRDGGESWQSCPEVINYREKYEWNLPYSPEAGCVRGFAIQKNRVYAAVEQGGLLRSYDFGRSWELLDQREEDIQINSADPWIHHDVHSVRLHTSTYDQIFAATGNGLYYSTAEGASWSKIHPDYCRDIWIDSAQPSHIIVGSADGPDRNGSIKESITGGASWHPIMRNLPETWSNTMVEKFLQINNELFAVLSNGAVISTNLDNFRWKMFLDTFENVQDITWMEGKDE
ncbi:MAG: hypothetical protein CL609_06075 [Anaerolineaceae bacterium]|nr:hypothetical protein [Anaerolineaceae bacterium]